jgi:ABC-type uncharacterized transport system ATPase subunit
VLSKASNGNVLAIKNKKPFVFNSFSIKNLVTINLYYGGKAMKEPLLEMRGITKSFPGVVANNDVNLTIYPGEVHALLGENGAGKSTLMNILTGLYRPDKGEIIVRNKKVELRSPRDAVELGIGMVHQHFRLVYPHTVMENIILGVKQNRFFLKPSQLQKEIEDVSIKYGLKVDPTAKIWQLSVGEQQRVEIIKLLYRGAEILILDEPTAVLTPQEVGELFITLKKMAAIGKAVIVITHKLNEVMEVANRITVLRSGKSVATVLKDDTNKEELIKLMVGREVQAECNQSRTYGKEEILKVEKVNILNDKNMPALRDFSLTIHAGEILGIAGVAGNGQKELSEGISGLRKVISGNIKIKNEDITNHSPDKIIEAGVAFIPEDRLGMGLVPNLSLVQNLILKRYKKEYSRRGMLNHRYAQEKATQIVKDFDIKNSGMSRPVKLMSGGNQQKLLLAREISKRPVLLIAAYPSRGLDISATEAVHKILLEQKQQGTAILLISEDLDELVNLSDRIAVMFEGRIMGIVDSCQANYEEIGLMMTGVVRKWEGAKQWPLAN